MCACRRRGDGGATRVAVGVRPRAPRRRAPPPSSGEGGGGIEAREETADALVAALAAVTPTELVRVGRLCDAPLVCPFTNACFAQVCVERGLLVLVPPLLPPEIPPELAEPVDTFSHALSDIEGYVQRILRRPAESCPDDASPLERARLHLTVAYTVNSLYWMYLRASGQRVQNHPVKAELARIQKYLAKVKAAEGRRADDGGGGGGGGRDGGGGDMIWRRRRAAAAAGGWCARRAGGGRSSTRPPRSDSWRRRVSRRPRRRPPALLPHQAAATTRALGRRRRREGVERDEAAARCHARHAMDGPPGEWHCK